MAKADGFDVGIVAIEQQHIGHDVLRVNERGHLLFKIHDTVGVATYFIALGDLLVHGADGDVSYDSPPVGWGETKVATLGQALGQVGPVGQRLLQLPDVVAINKAAPLHRDA